METYRPDLIPPYKIIQEYSGGISSERFDSVGKEILENTLIKLAGLQPHHRLLDIGCGCGKLARALTAYFDAKGSYYGMDIAAEPINWCKEKYAEFPNFHFEQVDIYSSRYNPEGKYKSENYIFPHPDEYFDVVYLGSVFTHMLPSQVKNYLHEILRMLKPEGKCIITYFLLDEESLKNVTANLTSPPFPYGYGPQGCRIASLNAPEAAIAYDEKYVASLYRRYGFSIKLLAHGEWGRGKLIPHWQDLVLAEKDSSAGLPSAPQGDNEKLIASVQDLASQLDQLSEYCARLEVRLQYAQQSMLWKIRQQAKKILKYFK
jgi:ubiquinone/menaquinone biosynthesis C-methylase UbiE